MRRRTEDAGADGGARERILDAAAEAFAADGFDATPTARIAKVADVPKGLLFYYFPKKIDVLLALLGERLPEAPLCRYADVVVEGDVVGSLRRLADRLDLGGHESVVLRSVLFREAGTHPEVRAHLHALNDGLVELTEHVLDAAHGPGLDAKCRHDAAITFVAVMLFEANSRRFDGPLPDLTAAARLVADGLSVEQPA
ncbi:MAG TPA: TetR/AcrR family transcriptional regulator [Streptosporangiales bacterium]